MVFWLRLWVFFPYESWCGCCGCLYRGSFFVSFCVVLSTVFVVSLPTLYLGAVFSWVFVCFSAWFCVLPDLLLVFVHGRVTHIYDSLSDLGYFVFGGVGFFRCLLVVASNLGLSSLSLARVSFTFFDCLVA